LDSIAAKFWKDGSKRRGYDVLTVRDGMAAIDHARREPWDAAVLVSTGSLVNVADTAFNLRDLNRSMEIIILVNRLGPRSNRFLRPLLEHPIERTRVLTRRQLQRELTTRTHNRAVREKIVSLG